MKAMFMRHVRGVGNILTKLEGSDMLSNNLTFMVDRDYMAGVLDIDTCLPIRRYGTL